MPNQRHAANLDDLRDALEELAGAIRGPVLEELKTMKTLSEADRGVLTFAVEQAQGILQWSAGYVARLAAGGSAGRRGSA